MRAADALMECLKAEGVENVFGLPGGANLPTYDALYDAGIRHVLVRHEAGGGHAAEGYAKATGRVGVAFGTSGPGATNLVTPITDAMLDSVPTVFITMEVVTGTKATLARGDVLLAEGRTDGTVRLLETATGGERRILTGHHGQITSLAWSADCRILISASNDTTSLVWDVTGLSSDPASAK